MAHGGRARGEMVFNSLKNLNWFDLAGDEGGGMGGGVGRWPMEGGQGGRWGGGTREQCKRWTGSFFGLPIWLVTRVRGWGEAWGGGPWRAGKGGDWGGHQRAVWEQQKMHF